MKMILIRFLLIFFCFSLLQTGNTQSDLHTTNKDLPCVDKVFQVHAHVILDSLGNAGFTPDQLRTDLALASSAFSPICIGFELCGIDTITNYMYDSIGTDIESTEIFNIFHVDNRINVYLASELQEPPTCGYASLSGVATSDNASVYLKCMGTTLVHELGHLFGLLHTFEGSGAENVDGSNCSTEGDLICDTPADPYIEGAENIVWQTGCEFVFEGLDANGEYYSPHMGNYMSYYGCDCGFTRGQYIKMAETYLANPVSW